MIPEFEFYTQDVTEEDIETINLIAKGFNVRVGKHKAISNKKAREIMYTNLGIKISDPQFRKFVQHIRAYNLCPRLCSCSKGYYIAPTNEEYNANIKAFASRVRSMQYTLAAMKHYEIVNKI